MKKLLIVNNNLHIGGVQKALLNLLDEIAGDYEITLLLFSDCGALRGRVPDGVRVITPRSPFRWWGLTRADCKDLCSLLCRSFWAALTRTAGRPVSARLAGLFQKKLRGYDAAISYLHSGPPRAFYGGCCEFVLRCVETERKIAFLHCDYGAIGAECASNTRLYERFDRIAACSEGCRTAFLRVLPQLAGKTVVIPNCQNDRELSALAAQAPVPAEEGKLRLVTVARFGREKAVPRAIRAVAALGDRARMLRYDIIGDGAEYAQAEEMISALGLEDTVFLHGELENPYGYVRAADVLLIPSVSEAAPLVIGEAARLGTPILTTETSSARELVGEAGLGWVCENSEAGVCSGIGRLLSDPEEVKRKQESLRTASFDNSDAVRRFAETVRELCTER